VITDFRMPCIDGLCLTAAVRAMDAGVPILMISGEEIGDEARARGATAFIRKAELTANLESILENIGVHAPAC
jgi:FixJ family two-component response regulator